MRLSTLFLLALILCHALDAAAAVTLKQVARYRSGDLEGTEIVAVHAASQRAYLSNSSHGYIDVLDLSDPAKPRRERRLKLDLAPGEDLTSIALHPSGAYLLCAIEVADPQARGRIELRATADDALLKRLEVGVGPDGIAISADGRIAVVADEAEEFVFDRATRTFSSPPGTITIVDLAQGPAAATAITLALPDLTGVAGVTDGRMLRRLERRVDVNGDGRITAPADLNGDGDIDDEKVRVGTLAGIVVFADEANGELFQLPLAAATPEFLEPECVAIAADGTRAYVTLQESNAVAVVDLIARRVTGAYGLGIVLRQADLNDDDRALFEQPLQALREPDGIALSADGRFLLTADEGDTDPKVAMMEPGLPAGGGRSLSLWDPASGALVGDTGIELDRAAALAGFYPDSRSGAKGAEPEMVVSFLLDSVLHAGVSLERANGVALVSLADPAAPVVVAVASADRTAKAGAVGPEGIAHLLGPDGLHYLLTANEKDGSLSIYRISARK